MLIESGVLSRELAEEVPSYQGDMIQTCNINEREGKGRRPGGWGGIVLPRTEEFCYRSDSPESLLLSKFSSVLSVKGSLVLELSREALRFYSLSFSLVDSSWVGTARSREPNPLGGSLIPPVKFTLSGEFSLSVRVHSK